MGCSIHPCPMVTITSAPASSPFGLAGPDENHTFFNPLVPMWMPGQPANSTPIAWGTFSTCYSYPPLLAPHENRQPGLVAHTGAVIGSNDGAFLAHSDNIQDSLVSSLNFGSNEYFHGSSGFPASLHSFPVPVDLGGPSVARTTALSVL